MESNLGKATLPAEVHQTVYDTCVENTVTSTDNRNTIAAACISEVEYVKQYHGIENKTVQVEEKKKKSRRVNMSSQVYPAQTVVEGCCCKTLDKFEYKNILCDICH